MKLPVNMNLLPYSIGANVVLVVAVGLLGWRLIDARSDVKEQIGRCNTAVEAARADAEAMTRGLMLQAATRRQEQFDAELESTRHALEIARESAYIAQNQRAEAQRAIRTQPRDDDASKCLDMPVPASILNSLRD